MSESKFKDNNTIDDQNIIQSKEPKKTQDTSRKRVH